MNGIDNLIWSLTSRQHGLIARWQARGLGIADHQLDDRIRRGALIAVHPGVYRHPAVPYTRELRWLAAVLAGGEGAVLSHQAAGVQHHFDLRRVKPAVTTPHRRHPEIDGITFHRTRRHTPLDIVVVNKIPVTTRARTMLDCAAELPFSIFELMMQDAVARGLVAVEDLIAIIDRRGGRGVEGTVAQRTALENGLVDEQIESKLELIVARIIDAAGVPKPVRQHPLTCADGREVRLDNAWPDRKTSIEADGRRWHGNAYQAQRTRARSRSIVATGWQHYVYGWAEATETPLAVRAEVEEIVLGPFIERRAG